MRWHLLNLEKVILKESPGFSALMDQMVANFVQVISMPQAHLPKDVHAGVRVPVINRRATLNKYECCLPCRQSNPHIMPHSLSYQFEAGTFKNTHASGVKILFLESFGYIIHKVSKD